MSRVFDASEMHTAQWKSVMKDLDMLVAFGVSPCATAGHTLRTRAGHCAQCDTAKLAFLRRHGESGEVYVAVSRKASLVKIGTATDAPNRMQTSNIYAYGGSDDWAIAFRCHCEKAGQIEFLAQKSLRETQTRGSYNKLNQVFACRELFACEPTEAIKALKAAMVEIGVRTSNPSGLVFGNKGPRHLKLKPRQDRGRSILLKPNRGGFTPKQIAAALGIKLRLVLKHLLERSIFPAPEQPISGDVAKQVCKEFGFTLTIDWGQDKK